MNLLSQNPYDPLTMIRITFFIILLIKYNRSMAEYPFTESNTNRNNTQLVIPLISKRLNNIEKYISDFSTKDADTLRHTQSRKNTMTKRLNISERKDHHQYQSAQLSPFIEQEELGSINQNACIKYNSIIPQKSEQRIESLSRLEKDYNMLKQKMHPTKKSPRAVFSHKSKNEPVIAEEDVQRQIKTSIINQNGKKYFADLYLLKKGRQQIMNSLSGVGKLSIGQQRSYQQKVKSNQHQFVKNKILQDREINRTKMLKGRNLHWNVYYDMLALSSNEKKKLKGICKFTNTFGIQ